jgi:hypothetical protein
VGDAQVLWLGLLGGPFVGALMAIIVVIARGGAKMAFRAAQAVCVTIWVLTAIAIISGHANGTPVGK